MQRVSGCKEGEACNEFWGARGSWGGKCCLGGADLYQAGGGGEEACKRRWGRARRRMVQQAGGVQGPGGATPEVSDGSRSCAPTPRSRPRSPFGCQPRRPQPRRAFTQPTVQRCVPSLAAPACAKQSPRAAPRRGRCHQCPPGMGLEQEPPPPTPVPGVFSQPSCWNPNPGGKSRWDGAVRGGFSRVGALQRDWRDCRYAGGGWVLMRTSRSRLTSVLVVPSSTRQGRLRGVIGVVGSFVRGISSLWPASVLLWQLKKRENKVGKSCAPSILYCRC